MAPQAELEQLIGQQISLETEQAHGRMRRALDSTARVARSLFIVTGLAVALPAAGEVMTVTLHEAGVSMPGLEVATAFATDAPPDGPPPGSHECNPGETDYTGHGHVLDASGTPVAVVFCSDKLPNGPTGGGTGSGSGSGSGTGSGTGSGSGSGSGTGSGTGSGSGSGSKSGSGSNSGSNNRNSQPTATTQPALTLAAAEAYACPKDEATHALLPGDADFSAQLEALRGADGSKLIVQLTGSCALAFTSDQADSTIGRAGSDWDAILALKDLNITPNQAQSDALSAFELQAWNTLHPAPVVIAETVPVTQETDPTTITIVSANTNPATAISSVAVETTYTTVSNTITSSTEANESTTTSSKIAVNSGTKPGAGSPNRLSIWEIVAPSTILTGLVYGVLRLRRRRRHSLVA